VDQVLALLRTYMPELEIDLGSIPRSPQQKDRERPKRPRRKQAKRKRSRSRRKRAPVVAPLDPVVASSYSELVVPYGADLRTVRSAWVRLVRRLHPDLQGSKAKGKKKGADRVRRVNQAYGELRRHLRPQSLKGKSQKGRPP